MSQTQISPREKFGQPILQALGAVRVVPSSVVPKGTIFKVNGEIVGHPYTIEQILWPINHAERWKVLDMTVKLDYTEQVMKLKDLAAGRRMYNEVG